MRASLLAGAIAPAILLSSGVSPAAAAISTAAIERQPARNFTPHTPTTAVHTDFTVEVNRKGQVTRVKAGKSCPDLAFNAMTYGNALQAFIRTEDGRAISGLYRLSYDFNPRTKLVRRSVQFLHSGGTDPNKLSAVDEMAIIAHRHRGPVASPAPTGSPLPDIHDITGHHH